MTTEVAIINREAIALAADSAVTVDMKESKKIYNSANKLFALSRKNPVGVMVYGNASLVGVPWETLIKIYRKNSENKSFLTLKEYGEDFLDFLNNSKRYFLEEDIEMHPALVASQKLYSIKIEINNKINELEPPVPRSTINKVVNEVIEQNFQNIKGIEILPQYKNQQKSYFINLSRELFEDVINQEFGDELTRRNTEKLITILVHLMISESFSELCSGVVVAGFGEDEAIPDLVSYDVECFFDGKLKFQRNSRKSYTKRPAPDIIGFAQDDMIEAFMTGISPELEYMSSYALSITLKSYFDTMIETIDKQNTDKKEVENLRTIFRKQSDEILKKYAESLDRLKDELYSKPIYDIISVLPKGELAEMAESLVSLTALKRRTSADDESVGIPVDVALISKGDGFVWIKRKHYFDPNLNRDFFRRD